jgi:hypothetical protein
VALRPSQRRFDAVAALFLRHGEAASQRRLRAGPTFFVPAGHAGQAYFSEQNAPVQRRSGHMPTFPAFAVQRWHFFARLFGWPDR